MKIYKNDHITVKCFDPKHYSKKSFWVFLHSDWDNPFIIQKRVVDGEYVYNIASVNLSEERFHIAQNIKATLQEVGV